MEGSLAFLVSLPCLLFEDDHLLAVNKPPGINMHAPHRYAGEGLHEWLRHREPRWAALGIVHRLDKVTSGALVFAKTREAGRRLGEQFQARSVRKTYLLQTDRPSTRQQFSRSSTLKRTGGKYRSTEDEHDGVAAQTRFHVVQQDPRGTLIEAEPLTGRTHQIRVHAAEAGLPILGDTDYGGTAFPRVCLHAAELRLRHPVTNREIVFSAPVDFAADPARSLRGALIDADENTAFRMVHGASDGWPGWYVDRLGGFLLSQSEGALTQDQRRQLSEWCGGGMHPSSLAAAGAKSEIQNPKSEALGAYHKTLVRRVLETPPESASAVPVLGEPAPGPFIVRENGLRFELSFDEGYSVGLFLDQRDNRRRLLVNHVSAGFPLFSNGPAGCEVLNTFAYTCGFSVCAATAGALTTSLDLSRKYLDWGRRNFELNGLDPARHDFIYGDVLNWLPRLARKGRRFDLILLDPPTFSKSKQSGVFQAERHYGRLVEAALPMLKPGGVLFASTNAARLEPDAFITIVTRAVERYGRPVRQQHYVPQPPDFPITPKEPGYLKTLWLRT